MSPSHSTLIVVRVQSAMQIMASGLAGAGVTEGDVRVRRAEHTDDPPGALLSRLRHGEAGCRTGVHDGPRMEVPDIGDPNRVPPPPT